MSQPRTYWHLARLGRRPTDYEIASSRLLYHPAPSSAVEVPLGDWYRRHQPGMGLRFMDWEAFSDPRGTTYATYVELKRRQEIFVEGLFAQIEGGGYDRALAPEWLGTLEAALGPLRYPIHGLQMVAAYLGRLAPGGRVAIACTFQVGDEIRRVHTLAHRTALMKSAHPTFAGDARQRWEDQPAWQPWRRIIEELLVTWDWSACFAGLQLAVKPVFDRLFLGQLAAIAGARGDPLLALALRSLEEDAAWSRAWSAALVQRIAADPGDAELLAAAASRWRAPLVEAASATAGLLGCAPEDLVAQVAQSFEGWPEPGVGGRR